MTAAALAPLVRLDRALLRSPVVLASGALRVEAITAKVGAELVYPWGIEVATAEALQDPTYLDASRGLPVVVHHPASGTSREGDGTRVGTVTGARFDAESGTVIRELTISDPATIARVQAHELTEISEGYDVPPDQLHKRADGVSEQRRRVPNHYALTDRGRLPGAKVRLDEGEMTEELIRKIIREEILAAFQMRDDAAKSKMDEADPAAVVAAEEKRMDELVASRVALLRRADELGVTIPETAKTDVEIARAIAVSLGADAKRCDSIDYARAWIDAGPTKRTDSWAHELAGAGRRAESPSFRSC